MRPACWACGRATVKHPARPAGPGGYTQRVWTLNGAERLNGHNGLCGWAVHFWATECEMDLGRVSHIDFRATVQALDGITDWIAWRVACKMGAPAFMGLYTCARREKSIASYS